MLSTGFCGNAVDHRAPYFGVRFTPNHIHAQQVLAQDDVVRYLNSFPEIQATTVFVLDGGPFSQCKSADGRHEAGEDFRKTWRFAREDRCGTMWDGVRGMTHKKKTPPRRISREACHATTQHESDHWVPIAVATAAPFSTYEASPPVDQSAQAGPFAASPAATQAARARPKGAHSRFCERR